MRHNSDVGFLSELNFSLGPASDCKSYILRNRASRSKSVSDIRVSLRKFPVVLRAGGESWLCETNLETCTLVCMQSPRRDTRMKQFAASLVLLVPLAAFSAEIP